MAIRIYNTLSKKIEEFISAKAETVDIYSCGPTVYSFAHIGNFRTFLFNDLLRRYLKFCGFTVNHAMNITDVDDKTIAGAAAEGLSLQEYTSKYADIFFDDMRTLNIEPVEHTPRATDCIEDMLDIIKRLDEKGLVYTKDGSVYFNIAAWPKYGHLSNVDASGIKTGLRYDTDEYEKEDVRDFALWKAPKDGEPAWDTPWGNGRPGWHIECSAMIRRIFGSAIDIHTGGVDLIFPHHENEIAQSEAAFDEPFVRYWMHAEHLLVNGAKMSKSKGNFFTLRDLLSKGYSPRSIRYLLLSAHYRKQLNFTFDGLEQANQALLRIDNFLSAVNDICRKKTGGKASAAVEDRITGLFTGFVDAMDDDLNISGGLGALFEFLRDINTMIASEAVTAADGDSILAALKRIDSVLGVIFFKPEADTKDEDASRIEALIAERAAAKLAKNFALADEIRDGLLQEGIVLEDSKDGTRWKKR